jgi:hypothetical protein
MLATFALAVLMGVFMTMVMAIFVVMAAAAAATVTAGKIFLGRDPSELDGLGDRFLNHALQVVHFFLGIQEGNGNRIFEQVVPVFFKSGYFGAFQSLATVLLFLQFLAGVHDRFVLAARAGVGEESVDAFTDSGRLQLG